MRRRLLFTVPLVACAFAFAASGAPTAAPAECGAGDGDPSAVHRTERSEVAAPPRAHEDDLSFLALSQVDARGAYQTIDKVRRDIATLSPEDRSRAAASMQVLTVTCAYTRAAVQLPIVLQQLAVGLESKHFDPLVHQDVAYLQQGLEAHVEILEALGVANLAVPQAGDALYGVGSDDAFVDRQTLRRMADPVQASQALLEAIPDTIEEGEVLERIRRHSHDVEQLTGHPWTLLPHLLGWHAALRRLEPFVVDAEQKGQVQQAIALLDQFANQGC